MKKLLLLFLLSFIVIFSFAQFPNGQQQGSATTLNTFLGGLKAGKGLINGTYTDTIQANLGNIDFYPGAQIFTTSDNGIWTRNSTATAWIQQGVGGSLVTTVTIVDSNHIQICTINGCDTITINNVVGPITNITILSDTTIQVCGSDVMSLPNCDTLQTIPTNYVLPNPLDNQCGLVPGTGVVTWDSLLKFDVSAARWKSCCDLLDYQTTFTVVTLAAADPSLPRIDAIVLDPTSGVTVVQGTAAADPAIPDISPCQVFLTAVLIQAGSTVPSGIGQLTVYDENNGGEWIPATVTGVTADFVNTTSPAHLLKAIHWESGATGTRQIVFNAPTAININDYSVLKIYIKLVAGIFDGRLMIDFPGSTSFGQPLSKFGFAANSAVGYQIIEIPLNSFRYITPTVTQLRLWVKGNTNASLDFYVDWIQFQSGITTPSAQTGIDNVNTSGNVLFTPVVTYPNVNSVNIAFPLDGFLPVNLLDTADGNDGDLIKKVNGVWTPYPDSLVIDTVYAKNWANARQGPVRDTIIFGSQFLDSSLLAYDTYAGLNGHFFAIQKDATTNRFKITPDSIYLAATISGSVTGMVWKLKDAATGSGYWGTASGGGINLYNTDSLLSGNRAVGLNGHTLSIRQGSNNFLYLDPTVGSEIALLQAYNTTGNDNYAYLQNSATNSTANFDIHAAFNDGDINAQIIGQVTSSNSRIDYIADTHVFSGDVLLNDYNAGASTDSVLTWDATGKTVRMRDAASFVFSADNGLTDSSGRVILGGSLYKNTTVATANNTLTISTGTSTVNPFKVISTNAAAAYGQTATGFGVIGLATGAGIGVQAWSTTGLPLDVEAVPASTNTVYDMIQITRQTSGTGANGIGAGILFSNSTTTFVENSGRIINKWTDATNATRTSQTIFTGVLSASAVNLLTLNADGSIQLRPITATAASAITPAEGMIVMVSSTDATFISIGMWAYQNGAWKAL